MFEVGQRVKVVSSRRYYDDYTGSVGTIIDVSSDYDRHLVADFGFLVDLDSRRIVPFFEYELEAIE